MHSTALDLICFVCLTSISDIPGIVALTLAPKYTQLSRTPVRQPSKIPVPC